MNGRTTEQTWQVIVEALPEGVALSDATQPDQPVVYVNPAFEKLTGYALGQLEGKGLAALYGEANDQPGMRRLRDAVEAGMETRAVLQAARRDGGTLWVDVQVVPVRDEAGDLAYWLWLHRETEARGSAGTGAGRFRAMAPELLQRQDPLTGFRIREAFEELLEHQLAVSQRERQSLALFLFEVDDFGRYTDTFDRSAGDALLRRVASAIAGSFRRRSDLLARVGDCSFAALAHSMTDEQAQVHADTLIQRIRALAIHHPRSAVGRFVTLSVGITSGIPGTGSGSTTALEAAEAALREARSYGGNRHGQAPLPGGEDAS